MKVVITFLLFSLPQLLSGQSLTLDELISYRKMDLMKLNDVLAAKNWEFSSSDKNGENVKSITWAFGKSYDHYNDQEKASAWLTLFSNLENNNLSYLSYQVHETRVYTGIKNRMEQYKMKLLDTSVELNEISSRFNFPH